MLLRFFCEVTHALIGLSYLPVFTQLRVSGQRVCSALFFCPFSSRSLASF